MTIADTLRCVRPVVVELDDEVTPYAGQGSCFLAKRGSSFFVFTAAHVVRGVDSGHVLIFPNDESVFSIPFDQLTLIEPRGTDTDYSDVVAFRIDTGKLVGAHRSAAVFVDLGLPGVPLAVGDALLVAGYPDEFRVVDYDARKIAVEGQMVSGEYVGHSISEHCHKFAFRDVGPSTNASGFSGSPVFRVQRHGGQASMSFAGMVIRASLSGGFAHFIDGQVIRNIAREPKG